jgi:UDP-glucose 4-epimerase
MSTGVRSLVVGGAGFVGSHVVDRLLAEGHTVDVVDDLSTGSLSNLAMARAEHIGSLKFHNVDVRQPELADLLGRLRPEVAVHLALPSSGPPARVLSTALGGTANLLDAAVTAGTTKVVVGLDAVAYYGAVPLRELPIKEGALGTPGSSATIAQRAVADLLALYREQHALEYTALALGSVYGTRQRPAGGVVAAFVAARQAGRPAEVYGTGKQTRDFVAVDDAVDALVRATTRGTGLVINVGTGVQTSVAALHQQVLGVPLEAAVRGPARDGDVDRFALLPVRARIHLAWAPWTDLATGIGQLLAELAASTPPASTEPPAPERSGGELVDGVAGADDAALHDAGVDPAQMELPTDG